MLFKALYSEPKLAQELLKLILTKKEFRIFNVKKLRVEKDSFKGKRADLILSIPFKEAPRVQVRVFILLEHKSSYDKNLFDQILDYQYLMRKHSIQQVGYPQPIIPILFYHGKEPMRWKKTLQEADFQSFFLKIPSKFKRTYTFSRAKNIRLGIFRFFWSFSLEEVPLSSLCKAPWNLKHE